MNEALVAHQIHPVIDYVYPFEDAKSAFSHLEKGSNGKNCDRILVYFGRKVISY